ncbi:MAG: glycosyltransferase family 2 protein [Ignavibacteria bacterium]|nr:glycosyltransferase family 2 protein [Ignavibacteria bacterium]
MVIPKSSKEFLVSVIISVYNRKRKLLKALESVINQTYQNIEIIIADDGSTDEVEKSISKYIYKLDNIIYFKHKNRGPALTLNRGIKISNGDYITFLDSDDEYLPEHIERRVNIFYNNSSLDIIHTTAKIIGKEEYMLVPDANNPEKLIHLNQCVIGATIFGKRKVFLKLNGFKNIYAYDYDLIKRASKKFTVKKFDIPTYIYNRNSRDSILTKYKRKSEL